MSEATQRNTTEALKWGNEHNTTAELGYNPNGRCLQIAREGRNIAPMFPSALAAALATPQEHRIYSVSNFKKGMILFYDDPNDSNPYGHVAPLHGRVKDAQEDSLHDLIVRSNSVVSGRTVLVRGDYFLQHWGDPLMFAADWLNGEPFYDMQKQPKPDKPKEKRHPNIEQTIKSLRKGVEHMSEAIKANEKAGHPRYLKVLRRDRQRAIALINDLQKQFDIKK